MLEVPTIRIVRAEDPNGYVKGAITLYEVVDMFDMDTLDAVYSDYTERGAEDFIISWLEGA